MVYKDFEISYGVTKEITLELLNYVFNGLQHIHTFLLLVTQYVYACKNSQAIKNI